MIAVSRRHRDGGRVMTAIHLRATGLTSEWTARTLKTALGRVKGVARIALVRSLGLVSVLFDEQWSSPEQIVFALRAAGVEARICRPGTR
jgi:copper chaperone CopZ